MNYAGFNFVNPVLIADQEGLNDAKSIIGSDKYVDYASMTNFIQNNAQDFSLQPVVEAAIDINDTHQALIWHDPVNPKDPDYMFSVIIALGLDEQDNLTKKISGIVCGDKFQGVLMYRKSCCSETDGVSALITTIKGGEHVYNIGDGIGTKPRFKQLFSPENAPDSVVFSTEKMKHIFSHALGHSCTHDHRHDLPTAIPVLV